MNNNFMWGDETLNDIISGEQQKYNYKKYYLNNSTGIMNIGKYKKNQEDSLLMLEQGGVNLLAIADGMGGMANGNIVSNYTLLTIGLWFQKRNINENISEKKLLEELQSLLNAINFQISRKYGGGTTLVLAIKLKNNTITINIGDSRIYIYKDSKLTQISKDQSLAWEQYLRGEITKKDDIRFYPYNNVVSYYLGGPLKDEHLILDNDDYNDLLLMSDGVSDLISDDTMESLIKKYRKEYEDAIIDYVLNVKDYNYYLDDYYNKSTLPGKDNASIIVYKK